MQTQKFERFEARLSTVQKQLIQRAADLLGRSLSDFVVNSSQEAARKLIREHEIITLSGEAAERFADSLLNPPEPNAALKLAAKEYQAWIENKHRD